MQVFIYHLSHYELAIQESTNLDECLKRAEERGYIFIQLPKGINSLAKQFLLLEDILGLGGGNTKNFWSDN